MPLDLDSETLLLKEQMVLNLKVPGILLDLSPASVLENTHSFLRNPTLLVPENLYSTITAFWVSFLDPFL